METSSVPPLATLNVFASFPFSPSATAIAAHATVTTKAIATVVNGLLSLITDLLERRLGADANVGIIVGFHLVLEYVHEILIGGYSLRLCGIQGVDRRDTDRRICIVHEDVHECPLDFVVERILLQNAQCFLADTRIVVGAECRDQDALDILIS